MTSSAGPTASPTSPTRLTASPRPSGSSISRASSRWTSGKGPAAVPAADDFEKPNGLAFSPDEPILYICDTARYHIRAFDVEPAGTLGAASGRVFARMDPGNPGGPDGVKVDRDGRVYAAVAQGVWVYEPDGGCWASSPSPPPANLAWCDVDAHGLAMTAVDAVYKVRLNVPGCLPPFTP